MTTRKYIDPELSSKRSSILLTIRRSNSGAEILRTIDHVFPSWIIDTTKSFDHWMKGLEDNWAQVCKKARTKPKAIIIVDEVVYYKKDGTQGDFSILLTALDKLTRLGYCIRSKQDLEVCKSCENFAIVSKTVHNWMIEQKKRDDIYTGKCTNCSLVKGGKNILINASTDLSVDQVSSIMRTNDTTPSPADPL